MCAWLATSDDASSSPGRCPKKFHRAEDQAMMPALLRQILDASDINCRAKLAIKRSLVLELRRFDSLSFKFLNRPSPGRSSAGVLRTSHSAWIDRAPAMSPTHAVSGRPQPEGHVISRVGAVFLAPLRLEGSGTAIHDKQPHKIV